MIGEILETFEPVNLAQIDGVNLMDRIDRKYWFHFSDLGDILAKAVPFYSILEINGQRITDYETVYFDTNADLFYKSHHNEKLNRFKVRRRKYLSTGIDFMEVKIKTNKQRTIKKRILSDGGDDFFTPSEFEFLNNSALMELSLYPALSDWFQRITLVSDNFTERCTIDLNIKFWNNKGRIEVDDLVVVEIKHDKSLKFSQFLNFLKDKKIRHSGLSKYCTGRAMLDPELKQNSFKPKLMFLKKKILGHEYSSN